MKVIIVGAGVVGIQLAKRLIEEHHDVVLIDKDPEAVKNTSHSIDCMVIQDKGNNLIVLKKAGIDKADFFICVTGSDELNLVTCNMVSQSFSKPVTIARVRNEDYIYPMPIGMSHKYYNVDHIINPGKETSEAIIRSIESGVMRDITLFEGTRFEMTSLQVQKSSFFSGKAVKDLRQAFPWEFLIGVILRGDSYIIPSGDTVIEDKDTIYFIATRENLIEIFKIVGESNLIPRSVVIVGGGEIGSSVASFFLGKQKERQSFILALMRLLPKGKRRAVTIVEKDYQKCKRLAETFPDALILNADISDEGFLEEQGFKEHDLIVTTTEKEDLNVITAMYAKSQGFSKAVTLVMQLNYVNVAYRLGIDVAISLKNCVIGSILKLIRRGDVKNT
ncbi:MAG: Trk system potassium transporter TrkA, partial [Spirochaetales bacterium]|nr:Trk system potassium transporter TrkA [Spirochaetales bacterium]